MNIVKNVGLDMDGVLVDLESYQIKKGKPYFAKKKNINQSETIVNENAYDIKDIFGCTLGERMKFWKINIWEYCLSTPAREGASEMTHKWHKEGRTVNIITSRAYVMQDNFLGKLFRTMAKTWLKLNNIYYDKIIFCAEEKSYIDKAEACRELDISVMVEDKLDNVEEISKERTVLCYNAKWNKDFKKENVTRIKDFYEIDEEIQKMENKKENTEVEFKKLSTKKLYSISPEERIEYYKNLRAYYLSLPYDKERIEKDEAKYKIASNVIIPVFNKLYHSKVVNPELVPEKDATKGTIFVANHLGSLDQFPIITAIGKDRPIHIMASETLLKLKRGTLYKNVGCLFVDLNNMKSMMNTMKEASKIILNGGDVLMFPEGTRNITEKYMLDFKLGPITLAQETGATIVPFSVNEDYKIGKNHLYVRVGKSFEVTPDDDLREANQKLQDIVATLIWENLELERENTRNIDREVIIENFQKKKMKLEKQREKINSKSK